MKQENKNLVSNKTLLLSTLIAIVFSIVIYLIVVLPAEFNRDPTGLGKKLGLTVLSQTENTQTPKTINADLSKSNNNDVAFRQDEQSIVVPANKGIEYKFSIKKHEKLVYEWNSANDSNIYFDFHGEPEGDTTGYFESYSIATTNQMEGTATVPFDGSHGWYWKNSSDQEITINLKTYGNYTVIGLKK